MPYEREGGGLVLEPWREFCITGCGVTTPEMYAFHEDKDDYSLTENELINHIQCEIQKGVGDTKRDLEANRAYQVEKWFNTWMTRYSLKMGGRKSLIGTGYFSHDAIPKSHRHLFERLGCDNLTRFRVRDRSTILRGRHADGNDRIHV